MPEVDADCQPPAPYRHDASVPTRCRATAWQEVPLNPKPPGAVIPRLQLDQVRKTIWLTRHDLRALAGGDADLFDIWLVLNGSREYIALAELQLSVDEELLTASAPEALPQVRPALTRFMRDIWSLRPDLQRAYDIRTADGQTGFVWWYFLNGVAEQGYGRFVTAAQRRELNEADPRVTTGGSLPVTRLMVELWLRRPDLHMDRDLRTTAGRESFLAWYFAKGMAEGGLLDLLDPMQVLALLAPVEGFSGAPHILALLWSADADLRRRFTGVDDPALADWAASAEAWQLFPILGRLAGAPDAHETARPARVQVPGDLPFGVNLIGYAYGELGLGEHIRMAARCLQEAGICFSVYNIDPGPNVGQKDRTLADRVANSLPYAVNIFCVSGFETAHLAALHGRRLFDGRRSIGYWHWELPDWPSDWRHAYDLVDEVWAPTRFNYDCFVRSSPKPVRHVPMAVTADATAGLARSDFGLPQGRFLFMSSFDAQSGIDRKNPQAPIRAFRHAFPRGDEPVGLVVKAMRVAEDSRAWRQLTSLAAEDSRILLINGTLSRGEILDLYRCCDCFVSLHRSEGFGVALVEAMLLGKPVIATGYSGNLDFTQTGTAALVDYRPRRVAAGEYPFAERLVWAEPDIGHAADWMHRMAGDVALRDRLSRAGRQTTMQTYAPAVVGAAFDILLRDAASARHGGPDRQSENREY